MRLISENQEAFVNMLNEDPENAPAAAGAAGAARADDAAPPSGRAEGATEGYVTVTQQDREAISRVII